MSLHVVIAEDDYLVQETVKKIIKDGIGLEVIDSNNSGNEETRLRDIREADQSFSTPPFLEPKKVTWWKNVRFLPGAKSGKEKEEKVSEAVKEALEKFVKKLCASDLPDNQHFILSGPSLLKTSIVAKTLQTKAEMVVFSVGKPWEQKREQEARAIEYAAELGIEFGFGVAKAFIDIVGVDTRSILSELNKIKCYLGAETRITHEVVSAITSPGAGVEPEAWSVTSAIGERNSAKLVDALKRFEGENGYAVFMTMMIEKFFRNLIDEKNGVYTPPKPSRFLNLWSLNELRLARGKFVNLRERAVSGGSVEQLILTEALKAIRRRGK